MIELAAVGDPGLLAFDEFVLAAVRDGLVLRQDLIRLTYMITKSQELLVGFQSVRQKVSRFDH